MVLPAGSSWNPGTGMGNDSLYHDTVHAGGRVEILGQVTTQISLYTIEAGGEMLLNPTSITLGTTGFRNIFTNYGLVDMPDGLTWTPSKAVHTYKKSDGSIQSVHYGYFKFVQAGGTWRIGGPFTWFENTDSNIGGCVIQVDGGKIEASGEVAFPFVTNCTISANAQLELNVADGGSFDLSTFTIGEGAQIRKTGEGIIVVGENIPESLTVEAGFVGFTNGLSEATISKNPSLRKIALATVGNRLDGLASYSDYDFVLYESAFNVDTVEAVFESKDAGLLNHVLTCLTAKLKTKDYFLEQDGEKIVIVPMCKIYTITVAGGVTQDLDTALTVVTRGKEIVDAENNRPFKDLTLSMENCIFQKQGEGTLNLSDKLKDFQGRIRIMEGIAVVTSTNQLGPRVTSEQKGAYPEVRVYDGATLRLETTEALADYQINWHNHFYFTGSGKDNLGAFNAALGLKAQDCFASASRITILGDTVFGFSTPRNPQAVGEGIDLNGHTLKVVTLDGVNDRGSFSVNMAINPPGAIIVDHAVFTIYNTKMNQGDEANTIILTNNARLAFYGAYRMAPWTLKCYEGAGISGGGAADALSNLGITNLNYWSGPIYLDDMVTVTGNARHGVTVHGVVSGPGGFNVQDACLKLVNPDNSFEGGVTVSHTTGAGCGELGIYSSGALPGKVTLNGTWLHLMNQEQEEYSLPAVEFVQAGESNAVLNVNGAACQVGTLAGAGVVTNGGVTVSGALQLKREDLEAGRKLAVDGAFVYAEGAKVQLDDELGLAAGSYPVLTASGGVTFAGEKRLDGTSARARKWYLQPLGLNEIVFSYFDGTKIILR